MSKKTQADSDADSLRRYLDRMGRAPLLTKEEEAALGERIQRGGKDAKEAMDKLVQSNIRLVISIAKFFARYERMSLLDMVQEGTIGMMRAAEKFDPSRGFRFSTYSSWWIKRAIMRATGHSKMIRLPPHKLEELYRYTMTHKWLRQKTGKEPTWEEVAEMLEVPLKKIQLLLPHLTDMMSLDEPLKDDTETTVLDMLKDESAEDAYLTIEEFALGENLQDALALLDPREEKILRLRTGLGEAHIYSLEYIGDRFRLSRERIRQIERKGLAKLYKMRKRLELH
jgi:RNA polymerase primary sigma factor